MLMAKCLEADRCVASACRPKEGGCGLCNGTSMGDTGKKSKEQGRVKGEIDTN